MTILFAGSAAYEFGNVLTLSTSADRYDPDYAPGAIVKGMDSGSRAVANVIQPVTEEEVWFHTNAFIGDGSISTGAGPIPVINLMGVSGNQIAGIRKFWNQGWRIQFSDGSNDGADINGILTTNDLVSLDVHYFMQANQRVMELYQNGSLVATTRLAGQWIPPAAVQMGGLSTAQSFFSEVVITEGNEPTLGWRLHTKRPNPSLPGLNTFDNGFWGSLANDNIESGAVATNPGSRLTGGFEAYTGIPVPIGIRGLMQTARYVRNGTLLNLHGQLRIDDVNYDTPDVEMRDNTRVFSFWGENPNTGEPFEVADLAGLQGGFYTQLPL